MEDLVDAAGAGERQRAEAEHPAEHALFHRDRFDLAEQQFEGPATQEADFDDYSLRRHAELGGLVIDERAQRERQSNAGYDSRKNRVDDKTKDPNQDDERRFPKYLPVQVRLVDDLFVRQQIGFDVAQEFPPFARDSATGRARSKYPSFSGTASNAARAATLMQNSYRRTLGGVREVVTELDRHSGQAGDS